jgi:hypothetical protein
MLTQKAGFLHIRVRPNPSEPSRCHKDSNRVPSTLFGPLPKHAVPSTAVKSSKANHSRVGPLLKIQQCRPRMGTSFPQNLRCRQLPVQHTIKIVLGIGRCGFSSSSRNPEAPHGRKLTFSFPSTPLRLRPVSLRIPSSAKIPNLMLVCRFTEVSSRERYVCGMPSEPDRISNLER